MKRIICIVLLCMLLLACQPTPGEEAVKNRTDGALEQAIVATAAPSYVYEAPSRWEETFMARSREVRVSADVEVPTAERFPVTTIKQHTLTTSDVVSFLQGVCAGDWVIRENEYSREELTEDLKHAAKGSYMGIDETTGEQIWQPNEEEMKRIQSLIEQAPLEDRFEPLTAENLSFPIKTIPIKDSAGTTWYLFAKNSTANNRVTLRRHRDGVIQTENVVQQGEATPGEPPHALEHIVIAKEDAIRTGDALIEVLGLKNFKVAEAQKAREMQSYTYAVYGEGWWLTYVNTLDGTVPCFYGDYGNPDYLSFTQVEATYAPPWRQECVQIFVTEEGIRFIGWVYPKETVMTASENVQLLPFSDIQKSVKKLLEYGTGGFEGSPILINRMVLTTSIAQIPNQGDEAFYVPTWVIFLTTEEEAGLFFDADVLLINAVDGTLIGR